MAERKQRNSNVEEKEVAVFSTEENEARGTITKIRVVDWISNGKHYPQLEKREFFRDDNGELKMGKAKGFTRKNLELLMDNWGEIMTALGSKAPEHQKPSGAAASAPVTAPAATQPAVESDF